MSSDPSALLAWAGALSPDDLPPTPFALRPGHYVADADRFLSSIRSGAEPEASVYAYGLAVRHAGDLAALLDSPPSPHADQPA